MVNEQFGEEINTVLKLDFVRHILGFPNYKTFSLIESKQSAPFYKLSPENGEFSFLLIHTFDFFKSYEFSLPAKEKHLLQIKDESKLLIFSIVNWRGGIKEATINLKAPIVVNATKGLALQIILDIDDYSMNEPLLQAIEQRR